MEDMDGEIEYLNTEEVDDEKFYRRMLFFRYLN